MLQGTDIPNLIPDQVVQYAADNVDHNKITVDGRNTFHGLGIMPLLHQGPRAVTIFLASQYKRKIYALLGMSKYCGLSYHPLVIPDAEDPTSAIDALWKDSLLLRPRRPGWSGLMQMVQKGKHQGQCTVFYLPMIDMKPSDLSCVYSTLCYVSSHTKRYNVTPIVTFDQPLWWKELEVRESAPEDNDLHSIVVCLGGFHTIMRFWGCIGHVMLGSGLQDVLEQLYVSNAVAHILSG